jgi:hypothetical protein
MSRQLSFQLPVEPIKGFAVLTYRAMTIAAASVNMMKLAAFVAFIDGKAMSLGSARGEGLDGFEMIFQHIFAEFFDV